MSIIQAYLFSKDVYTKRDVKHFLERNNIIPIKHMHITKNYYRIRVLTPNYRKYEYRIGRLAFGLDCIFEFLK